MISNIDAILDSLSSGEDKKIQDALSAIKNEGDANVIPVLLSFITNGILPDNAENALISLLADIKDSSLIPALSEEIENCSDTGAKARLIRICWESGQNFSALMPRLAQTLIEDDFEVAMEAATALSEQLRFADEQQLDNLHDILYAAVPSDETRRVFIEEVLENIEKVISSLSDSDTAE